MDYVILWILGSLFTVLVLLVVMLLARWLGDFSMPLLGGFLWRAGLVAGVTNAVHLALDPVSELLRIVVVLLVFVVLMMKLFHLDLWQVAVIVIVNSLVVTFVVDPLLTATLGF